MTKVKKIAIIAEEFSESSICLARYIAELDVKVDYYRFSGISDKGKTTGFEYNRSSRFFLYHKKLKFEEIPEMSAYCRGLPISFHLIRHSSLYRVLPFLYNYVLHKIVHMILSQDYDVVCMVGGNRLAVFHNELRGLRLVHLLHEVGSHQDNIKSSPLINLIIRDETPVIFFSQFTRNRFLSIQGADRCLSRVIPFGIFETILLYDRSVVINTHLDKNKVTFLYFGFIKPYKGLDVLAASMRILESYSNMYNIIVAGSGDDESLDYFKTQPNCFVLNKMLSTQELIALNKLADVVVLPYKSASQTGIVSTVFMFETPVIATRVGAIPDVVSHNENGLLIEKNAPGELASAMKHLIENPSEINRLSKGTRKFGHGDNYDWHNIAQETVFFFDELMNRE